MNADLVEEKDREAIFVGGMGNVRKRLANMCINKPNETEYPEELRDFLIRKVWKSTLKKNNY